MNTKRWLLASIAVFATIGLTEYIVHSLILMDTYIATDHIWRPMAEMKTSARLLSSLVFSLLFVFIFTKGYEGKGISEGVKYGLWMGLFVSIPKAYGLYSVLPIPYSLAIQWWIYETIQIIIYGIIAAAIYKPSKQ